MASDDIKKQCLESFGGWIGSLAGDIGVLMEVVKDGSAPRASREAAASGINYLFKSLDLIPDGIDDIGYLDDAFTVRVAAKFTMKAGAGKVGVKSQERIGQLATDVDLLVGLLGEDLYQRFETYVDKLRLGAARGRMVSEILDDAANLLEFDAEVAQFCKDYQAPEFHKDEKNLIKLAAFFDAKLPRDSRMP